MIDEALSFVSPEDRETWVKMGMAVKAELGEGGFSIWDTWSQQSDRYNAGDARSVWRSFKGQGIGIGTLYAEARRCGWQGEEPVVSPEELRRRARAAKERAYHEEKRERRKRERGARILELVMEKVVYDTHPYLARKGFPDQQALTIAFLWHTYLVVPMRHPGTRKLTSLQFIDEAGNKKFLYGTTTKGSCFEIGAGKEVYLCEGYATGLSVRAALQSLHREARVVVCFSAHNLAHIGQLARGAFVVADHDTTGTGEIMARQTNLPYWMPPTLGDANDFHRACGVRALAAALNELRRKTA